MASPSQGEPARNATRPEHLLVLTPDVFLAEAIASAAGVAGFSRVEIISTPRDVFDTERDHAPDLLMTTIEIAADQSFTLLREAGEHLPGMKTVVIIDDVGEADLAVAALINGAAGLALRRQGLRSLVRVAELVLAGELAVPRWLTEQLVRSLRVQRTRSPQNVRLSARQLDVLRLVADGATDRTICETLNISLPTVRSHLAAIFEKTGTGNRTAAAVWAKAWLNDEPG